MKLLHTILLFCVSVIAAGAKQPDCVDPEKSVGVAEVATDSVAGAGIAGAAASLSGEALAQQADSAYSADNFVMAEALYQKFGLKRVFYSAFVAVNQDSALPARTGEGPFFIR